MNELGLICIGVLLALALTTTLRWIDRDEARRRRSMADAILRRHGFTSERYVASSGVCDAELSAALEEFGGCGHIVLDGRGEVVGALCRRVKHKRYLRVVSEPQSANFRARN
jgi:hypothetical protein